MEIQLFVVPTALHLFWAWRVARVRWHEHWSEGERFCRTLHTSLAVGVSLPFPYFASLSLLPASLAQPCRRISHCHHDPIDNMLTCNWFRGKSNAYTCLPGNVSSECIFNSPFRESRKRQGRPLAPISSQLTWMCTRGARGQTHQ